MLDSIGGGIYTAGHCIHIAMSTQIPQWLHLTEYSQCLADLACLMLKITFVEPSGVDGDTLGSHFSQFKLTFSSLFNLYGTKMWEFCCKVNL